MRLPLALAPPLQLSQYRHLELTGVTADPEASRSFGGRGRRAAASAAVQPSMRTRLHSVCAVLTFMASAVIAAIALVIWQQRIPLTWSSQGPGFLIGRASVEASLWDVAFEGDVNVRSEKSLESLVLGQKKEGAQVLAIQEGDWLKLAEEEGYIKIKTDVLLMRKVEEEEEEGGTKEAAGPEKGEKSAAEPDDSPPPEDVCLFKAHHPSWSGNVSFYKDGKLQTIGMDTLSGKWKAEGPKLVINWDNYGTESLETSDGGHEFKTNYSFAMSELRTQDWWFEEFKKEEKKKKLHPENEIQCKRTERPSDTRSLFCFIIAAKKNGGEVELVKTQLASGIGILGCEDAAIVTDANLLLGAECAARVLTIPPLNDERRSTTASGATSRWLNVESFTAALDIIRQDGGFRLHRWTVKVDADAVFMPERLRGHLAALEEKHKDLSTVYIRNSNGRHDTHVHSSVEVLSQAATDKLAEGQDLCLKKFTWQTWEEGYFLERCLEELDVHGVDDRDTVGTSCKDTSKVAYHPFKKVDAFVACWKEAHETLVTTPALPAATSPSTSRASTTTTTELTTTELAAARPSPAPAPAVSITTTQTTSRTWAPAVG